MNTSNYRISNWFFDRVILRPLGLNKENSLVFWLILIYGSVLFGGLYHFQGNVPLVAGILYIIFIFNLSLFRLDLSLYLFLFTALLFDQYHIPNFPTITREFYFFSNLKEIPYVPFFEAGMVSPAELHMAFLAIGTITHFALIKDFKFKPITVWGSFLFFFFYLIVSFLYGLKGGGDFLIALWEVRALFYFCLFYILVPQVLNTKRDIKILFSVIIIGTSIKAFQGLWRFIELGYTTGGFQVLTNHEDALFIVALFMLLIAFIVFKSGGAQKKWLWALLIINVLGFYVAQRRASYASFMVSICALIVLLPLAKRLVFMKYFIPVLIVLGIYGAAFWNSNSAVGRPVQMIKSGFENPTKEENVQDYYSNLYRDFENYNLAQTVVNNPITGVGFGKKYDQPIPLININFPLRDYIPHNEIYWVIVKMGGVGFFAFWFFFNSFAARGAQLINRLKDPYLQAVCLVVVISVINQMVVSFFDLQLTYYRNMIFLGCMMGLLPVLVSLVPDEGTAEEAHE